MCQALLRHITLDHVDVGGIDGGCQHLDVDIGVPQLGHFQILQSEQEDTKKKGIKTSLVMSFVLWLKLEGACITYTPHPN